MVESGGEAPKRHEMKGQEARKQDMSVLAWKINHPDAAEGERKTGRRLDALQYLVRKEFGLYASVYEYLRKMDRKAD